MHISNTEAGNLQRPVTRVFMWGMMGVGKTTWGKRLASRIGWRHIDLDARVEDRLQMTVSEIFSQKGESVFREAEARVLDELIALDRVVVSAGGGAPCFLSGADKMRNSGLCIWLDAPAGLLADRILEGHGKRPLLESIADADTLAETLRMLGEQRGPYYEKAHWRVSVAGLKIADLASEVLTVIRAQ